MRRLLPLLALLLFVPSARGYLYWNDIRHSALLPDETVEVRVENPTGSGEENYVLYEGTGVQELEMTPVIDGPSTLEAAVPGPAAETRRYGFRLVVGDDLDFMPIRIEDGVVPAPEDLTQVAADAAGDEAFGYDNLDLVDCRVSFSGTELFAALENVGGGYPVIDGLTFFGYLLGIADPAQADPDTVFALMYTFDQPGIITPGLYKITGTGFGDLEQIGDVTVQEFPATNTLWLSCQLGDLLSDPDFTAWYDPADPVIGVAGFTQKITLLGGPQEADRTPGGRCYLREFAIEPGANQLPELSNPLFQGEGATATGQIDYSDPDGHCPILAEVVFDDVDTFPLYPMSTDYGSPVTYRTDAGIEPLANGTWIEALFRFSDNESDVVDYWVPATGIEEGTIDGGARLALTTSPNPAGPNTAIQLTMPAAGDATVAVYDVRGALVATLSSGRLGAGRHELAWDGESDAGLAVGSGVYFVRAAAAGTNVARKLVLVR
jgi:hypothetical protein